jgi:hypothetical protein
LSRGKPDDARQTEAAFEAMYRFILLLAPTVEKFVRSQKFLLGDRVPRVGRPHA